MSEEKKVFLDYDEVLVDLVNPWLKWLKNERGISVSRQGIPTYGFVEEMYGASTSDFFRTPGTYDLVFPLPGAQEFVEELKIRYGKDNVFIVSASYKAHRGEKESHASRHFGIDRKQIIHAWEKYTKTEQGVLVDDFPGHVLRHVFMNRNAGIVFTGCGEYPWSDLENYREDLRVERVRSCIDPNLQRVCDTYQEILSSLDGGIRVAV